MHTILLVIHLLLAVTMVGVILLQRSEGGGLGMGGNMGGMMTVRGTGNLLTRSTAILALGFMLTSLALAVSSISPSGTSSLLDGISSDGESPGAGPLGGEPLGDSSLGGNPLDGNSPDEGAVSTGNASQRDAAGNRGGIAVPTDQ